jgi:hypothetical protein
MLEAVATPQRLQPSRNCVDPPNVMYPFLQMKRGGETPRRASASLLVERGFPNLPV